VNTKHNHHSEATTIAQTLYKEIDNKLTERRKSGEYDEDPEFCEAREIVFKFRYHKEYNWYTGQARRIIYIAANTNVGYLASIKLCTTAISHRDHEDATKVSKPFFRYLLECIQTETPNILPSRRQIIIDEILADLETEINQIQAN
jgi:hypothetical protein